MIDAETFIYNEVVTVLRTKYPGIFVSSDAELQVPSFPAVIFVEKINNTASRYMTQATTESFSDVMFEAQAYSNKASGRKREAKEIIGTIDGTMRGLGFLRTTGQELPNVMDTTIARYVGRWNATIGSDGYIYRK